MIHFLCPNCNAALFFENTTCLRCKTDVGYDPETNRMVPLDGAAHVRCRNGLTFGVCNWIVPKNANEELCASCQLNRMIPSTSVLGNVIAWGRMESAKRRVLHTLANLGLRPVSKARSADGLVFDFLSPAYGQPVLTGHDRGVITLNLMEADRVYSEGIRSGLGEPYRTLVGHFRHEFGHYYWDRLLRYREPWHPLRKKWRELFGDERMDYASALHLHYRNGPPRDWAATYISAYASSHPWEDWAETWAQYLNILDAMETARDLAWNPQYAPILFTPFQPEEIGLSNNETDHQFLELVNGWLRMAPVLNEMAQSLGQGNLFPFVLTAKAVRKIHFVHEVVKAIPPLSAAATWPWMDSGQGRLA